jgi:hypothetical protein
MEMKEILGKKPKAKESDDMKKESKIKAIKEMRAAASDMMGGDIKDGIEGMKKVTVAAPDKESLAEGLDKAKEMLPKVEEMAEETEESPEEEASEESMSKEEIQAKIEELTKLLAEKK